MLHGHNAAAAMAALAALSAAAFAYVTTESLPVGLLQPISQGLHSSFVATGRLVTVYAAINVALSAPLAHLTKGLPRKATIVALLAALVLTSLAAAVAPSYGWLMAIRVVTALAQAIFWSLVIPTAASLFPPSMSGRAVGWVLGGASLAVVLGVPAGTWLGQQAGWRAAFIGLAGLAALLALPIAMALPNYHPSETHAGTGSAPDRRRYRLAMATTALAIGGFFCTYTYVSPFLTKVAGLALHDVAAVLFVTGAATVGGVFAGSLVARRRPAIATLVPVIVMAPSLIALYFLGRSLPAAIVLVMSACVALGAYDVSNQNRVLEVAPASTDIASAWASASFNAGIAGGSLLGGLVLQGYGPRATALLGGVLAGIAVFVAAAAVRSRPGAAPPAMR
ncbi:MAG: MFS transporter [Actinomycetota bacterium]|nr:MFS transporter [Actinomycetota bacterium]